MACELLEGFVSRYSVALGRLIRSKSNLSAARKREHTSWYHHPHHPVNPMKSTTATYAIAIVAALWAASDARAGVLLLNGGFETPPLGTTLATGNNIGVVPDKWTIGTSYTASNSNQQKGASTSGAITLQPYNGAFSADTSTVSGTTGGGTNFWDGTGTTNNTPVTLTQAFTLSTASNIAGTFAVGGRDTNSNTVSTTISFTGTTSTGGTYTSPSETGSTTNGVWTVKSFNLTNVPAGNYTYSIVLADFQNIDGASLVSSAVPEPSAWAMMVGGFGLLIGMQRLRRSSAI